MKILDKLRDNVASCSKKLKLVHNIVSDYCQNYKTKILFASSASAGCRATWHVTNIGLYHILHLRMHAEVHNTIGLLCGNLLAW